jgi:tRNA(Ile)-lysidine synthase
VSGLLEAVDQNIRARGLFQRGQKILVAVSGGVDSIVLLRLLHELSRNHKWKLTVAHLNHQLRGRSSDADERLVTQTAKAMRLPMAVERADVKQRAKTSGVSLEMAAREARHNFLARTAVRLRIPTVAMAHHADDRVELFFLRLLRGAGTEGLSGMKWRNPSPFAPDGASLDLVRPLLDQAKQSLRNYAIQEKVKFREDASNKSQDILRNRIRHELLPLLRKKYQPALDRVISQLMEIMSAEFELNQKAMLKWIAKAAYQKNFDQLPVAVQRRVMQTQLRRFKIAADFRLIESLRMFPDKPVTVAPRTAVLRDVKGLLQVCGMDITRPNPDAIKSVLDGAAGIVAFGGKQIRWKIGRQKTFHVPEPRTDKEVFDADKIGSEIVLRHWQPGDRFQPIGMAKSLKLQDFFVNNGIPRTRRHELVVATTAQNEVFWVEGMRISERFKLTRATKRRLVWQCKLG